MLRNSVHCDDTSEFRSSNVRALGNSDHFHCPFSVSQTANRLLVYACIKRSTRQTTRDGERQIETITKRASAKRIYKVFQTFCMCKTQYIKSKSQSNTEKES